MWGKVENFIQALRTSVIDKIVVYSIYVLINPFTGRGPIYQSKLFRYMMHFKAKAYSFILHYQYFFCFFIEIMVPGWTRIIKMCLNKSIAEHSEKLFCGISIFPINKF